MKEYGHNASGRLLWLSPPRLRLLLVALAMAAGFGILIFRLYHEQIRFGGEHRRRIDGQSVRRIRIPARRGRIFSSDGRLLAGNVPKLELCFFPDEMRQRRRSRSIRLMLECARTIAAAIGRENPLTFKELQRHLYEKPWHPVTVFSGLTPREAALALESSRFMRGVELVCGSERVYPFGSMAAHIIGYTRREAPGDAPDRREYNFYVPDIIGRSGIERAFDRIPGRETGGLRGVPGFSVARIDHLRYIHQSLIEKIEPLHGDNVVLTIDTRAQEIAEELLTGNHGALVFLEAETGAVLASASAPGYDLSRLNSDDFSNYYRELVKDPHTPLFNRALQGSYTPGSILKPLTALAFLNSGINPAEKTLCDGATDIAGTKIRCAAHRRGGHGEVDLEEALQWSCNDYMIEHALKVGLDPMAALLRSAGIGRKSGVELGESSGTFPSRELKQRLYRQAWNACDTGLLSIGQGLVTVTPIQAALFASALANGGVWYRPHLVSRVVDAFGNVAYASPVVEGGRLDASAEALDAVKRGMFKVVNTASGSGRMAAEPGLEIYGKTGSAEVGPRNNRRLMTWFIAFVEHKGKKYAGALIVEDGVSGGSSCAPLMGAFLFRYLKPVESPSI